MNLSAKAFLGAFTAVLAAGAISAEAVQPVATRAAFLAESPLYFEAHGAGGFVARGTDCTVSIRPTEAVILLNRRQPDSSKPFAFGKNEGGQPGERRTVRMALLGANLHSQLAGADPLSGKANYLIGSDASEWRIGIPLFAKVRANQVYEGIDLVYYADQSARLEYDFILQPGAAVSQIALGFEGADRVTINSAGELVLTVGAEEIRQHRPVIYQEVDGRRKSVAGGYRLLSRNTVGFEVSAYDPNLPLVIDPVLSFATFLGGLKADYGWSVAVDGANNIYVAGETLSKDLPGVSGTFQTTYAGGRGPFGDAFVAKYDATTRNLVYVTYLGGRDDDGIRGLAVDDDGNAYITGFTDSRSFPIIPANNQMSLDAGANSGRTNNAFRIFAINAFVARLNSSGTALDFSVMMGGNRRDSGTGIAVEGGDIFVTGMTESTNFVPIPNGAQTVHGGNGDSFVVKLTGVDPVAVYSTYLGGTNMDFAESIAVRSGEVFVAGYTASTNYPNTNFLTFTDGLSTNVIQMNRLNMQPKKSSRTDGFVTRLSAAGDQFLYSTFLGGTNDDACLDIKVDSAGNAYVTGYTWSDKFPTNTIVTPRAPGTKYDSHAFVAKIAPEGSNLVYSVDFGSTRQDRGTVLALDEVNDRVYVAGYTSWNDFFASNIVTDLRSTNAIARKGTSSHNDAFLVALQQTGGGIPLTFTNAVLFGGTGHDQPNSMVLKTVGADAVAWIAGQTTSRDFVVTNIHPPFQVQTNLGNSDKKKGKISDAFLSEFLFAPAP